MTDTKNVARRTDESKAPTGVAAALKKIGEGLIDFANALVAQHSVGDPLLPLGEAARVAACRSVRQLREAIAAGDLVAYGGERDRAIRRSDLDRWIESRRVVHAPIEDDDVERRMKRIAKSKASTKKILSVVNGGRSR